MIWSNLCHHYLEDVEIHRMRIFFLLVLLIGIQACSYSPQLTPVEQGRDNLFLDVSYGELLLQVYDDGVDSSWVLVENKSSIAINGKIYPIAKSSRQDYITKQGGFAYVLEFDAPKYKEGKYKLAATISKGSEERTYESQYVLEYKFGSIFQYLNAIFQQGRS